MQYTLKEFVEKTGISEEIIIKWFIQTQSMIAVSKENIEDILDENMIYLFQETLICQKAGIPGDQVEALLNSGISRTERLMFIRERTMKQIREMKSLLDTVETSEKGEVSVKEDLDMMFWGLNNEL